MMLVGGILMAVGTLLDWRTSTSGLSLDSMGLFGIITLILGIAIVGFGAIRAFGISVKLPDKVLGHTLSQFLMVDAFIVFLWTFALVAADATGAGVHLSWIGAAGAMVGAGLVGKSTAAAS
jgi:hypothetical protein